MFASEQHIALQIKDQTKKRLFISGTPLAKGNGVQRRFTYRELTLLIGIIVALAIIVLFTIMNRQSPELSSYINQHPKLLSSFVTVADSFVEKVMTEILF
jgi:hypothetical protein